MPECYHCKQWVAKGEPHDCWTTTEAALTAELSDDLQDAWERLRETAAAFGDQRIYASHKSIMFARKSCYFFVRPKRQALEVCFFLARPVNAPQVRRVQRTSRSKLAHTLHLRHRDEVEAPITDWLQEAYDFAGASPQSSPAASAAPRKAAGARTARAARPKAKAQKKRSTASARRTKATHSPSRQTKPAAVKKR